MTRLSVMLFLLFIRDRLFIIHIGWLGANWDNYCFHFCRYLSQEFLSSLGWINCLLRNLGVNFVVVFNGLLLFNFKESQITRLWRSHCSCFWDTLWVSHHPSGNLISFHPQFWFLDIKFQSWLNELFFSIFKVTVSEVEALYELYGKLSNSIIQDGLIHKVS